MNLVERQIRQLALMGFERFHIWVSPSSSDEVRKWRRDLHHLYRLDLELVEVATLSALVRDLGKIEKDVVLLEGDVVYDDRVLTHLLEIGPGRRVIGRGAEAATYLCCSQLKQAVIDLGEVSDESSAEPEEALIVPAQDLEAVASGDIGHYVAPLRLTMEPLMVRVIAPTDIAPLARQMYRRTFKGVIDAVARYGYYHLVRLLTYPLSYTSIAPNILTLLSIVGVWAAIPFFATGHLAAATSSAWAGVLLDSIDGKLARLRLHLSDRMGAFEHLVAAPGLALWYVAFGWHLREVESVIPGGELLWTVTGLGAFALDKVVSGSFKRVFGKEIFDFSTLDARFHLIAARRNITLLILTLGVITGSPGVAFEVAVVWMVVTFGYHLVRFIQVAACSGAYRA
jgi:hypothetical protein